MKSKYILICSDEKEGSTDIVCDWLNHYKQPFLRISSKNIIRIHDVRISNKECDIQFALDGKMYCLSEIKSYWYRRSGLTFELPEKVEKMFDGKDISAVMNAAFLEEHLILRRYFESELNKKAVLNKDKDNQINKLKALRIASDLGICIPGTLITREKQLVKNFSGEEVITKAIGDFMQLDDGILYYQKTNLIDPEKITYDSFFSTLFQFKINKAFELRIFFMNDKFYSSAIFSQSNEKTQLDFRNYDMENPNRVTPFQLPAEIEQKIRKLMHRLDMKSGSIDMAYTKEGQFVFFEVNPVGQFEQVSFPCNYALHQKIALFLSTNS